MKSIALTQGKFAIVDDIDFEFLMHWEWHYNHGYAKRTSRKSDSFNKRKAIFMHRVILNRMFGHDDYPKGDHENRNPLDNQRSNLRPATCSEDSGNKEPRGGSSKFKGVGWYKRDQKWEVQIKVRGKKKYLGYFDDEIEAAKAYNKAALEHFGEFAYLNDLSECLSGEQHE